MHCGKISWFVGEGVVVWGVGCGIGGRIIIGVGVGWVVEGVLIIFGLSGWVHDVLYNINKSI